MPELPDITVYVERLAAKTVGQPLRGVRVKSPFVLRTVTPSLDDVIGRIVERVERIGKRIVLIFAPDASGAAEICVVLHLMIAGRLRWKKPGAALSGVGLAAFDFDDGTLLFTEASKKKRASIHVVTPDALPDFDRGGHPVQPDDLAGFSAALTRENRTLKRALTDPRLLDGIGNAYSDEILHAAGLSPVKLTQRLTPEEIARLYAHSLSTLDRFTAAIRAEVGDGFPDKVTAFRPDMHVHGRYGEPCTTCGQAIQRIRYANKETNYCARCQNADRLLADRGLSRLLKKDWPKTLEELEALKRR